MQPRVRAKLGLVLIAIAGLAWVAILAVPFLAGDVTQKALIVTSLVVVSEVMFWLGIVLAGKELAHRYRRQLNPIEWWRKVTRKR